MEDSSNILDKVVIVGDTIDRLSQEVRQDIAEMMTFDMEEEFEEEMTQHDFFEESWENISLDLQYGNVARACFFREEEKKKMESARPVRSRVQPKKLSDYSTATGYR